MTDQKITTSQDILDQHYEEVEALQREIARLQEINAKLDSNCKATNRMLQAAHQMLMRHNIPCGSSDYLEATIGEGIIAGLGEAVEHASTTRDDKKAELLAKVLCRLVGIEPVDRMDGSCNWWLFKGLADEVVKKLAGDKDE